MKRLNKITDQNVIMIEASSDEIKGLILKGLKREGWVPEDATEVSITGKASKRLICVEADSDFGTTKYPEGYPVVTDARFVVPAQMSYLVPRTGWTSRIHRIQPFDLEKWLKDSPHVDIRALVDGECRVKGALAKSMGEYEPTSEMLDFTQSYSNYIIEVDAMKVLAWINNNRAGILNNFVVDGLEKFLHHSVYYVQAPTKEWASLLAQNGHVAYDSSTVEEGGDRWLSTLSVEQKAAF